MNDPLTGSHPDALTLGNAPAASASFLPPQPPRRRLAAAIRRVLHAPGRLAVLGGGLLAASLAGPALGQSLEFSALDGTNGFAINAGGAAVSEAGDVNGDGLDDVIIGAPPSVDPHGNWTGATYVVFGSSAGFAASLEVSALDGANGFAINGEHGRDAAGGSVSAVGDVNGDGLDDVIIGAYRANPNGDESGASYVVFGSSAGFAASLELSALDGTNGFAINGVNMYDWSGSSVSGAGDVNGDGLDDVLIGAPTASPNGKFSGASYVVFGSSAGYPASLELSDLDGTNGFVINGMFNGVLFGDQSGYSVSGAGDVNGDGLDDVLIGAPRANPNGDGSGASYVVFGSSAGFAASLELSALDGTNGFVINGVDAGDWSGLSGSGAGDVNGDGFDDVLIGAPWADPHGSSSGASYVVFGSSAGYPASLELSALDGANGFAINGETDLSASGRSVSGAGDINGDGLDDMLIGSNGDSMPGSGASYVVFGAPAAPRAPLDIRVAVGSDDAEESAAGSVDLKSSDLELIFDQSDQTVGLRFNGVAIEPGSVVAEAYIQFTADEVTSGPTSLTIYGQASDHAATFAQAAANISSRPQTAASVTWSPAPWSTVGAAGPDQRTPDLSAIINEIVNRDGWSSGNSLAIMVTGSGERVAESYNGDAGAAPLLHIRFADTAGHGPPSAPSVTIAVPSDGATVTEGTAVEFTGSASDPEDGDLTGAVSWRSSLDGPLGSGASTTRVLSVGTHFITASVSDSDGLSGEASITVTVTPQGGGTQIQEVRVASGSDDAEESATGAVTLTSTDLELIFDKSDQVVGMRFNGLSIPQGVYISKAYVQFQADETTSGGTSLTIQGEDGDNAMTFDKSNGNISLRPRTTAAVLWQPSPWTKGDAGPEQRTPDIRAVIQEVVSRSGWSSGNSLVLLITGSGERVAESYNGLPEAAPLLHVEFQ